MPAVGAADGGDFAGMTRGRKPVVHGGTDRSSPDGQIARPVMPGD
jgi:hypothetical protein